MKARSLLLCVAMFLIFVLPAAAGGQKTLGFTVDELPQRLQASIDRHETRLKLGELGVKPDGDHDIFVIPVVPGLLLGGTVDKTSRKVLTVVVNLDMPSAKENTVGLQYILCATTMMEVCSPELTGMQRDAVLRDIGLVYPRDHVGETMEKSVGAVHYRHLWTQSEATFGAAPL